MEIFAKTYRWQWGVWEGVRKTEKAWANIVLKLISRVRIKSSSDVPCSNTKRWRGTSVCKYQLEWSYKNCVSMWSFAKARLTKASASTTTHQLRTHFPTKKPESHAETLHWCWNFYSNDTFVLKSTFSNAYGQRWPFRAMEPLRGIVQALPAVSEWTELEITFNWMITEKFRRNSRCSEIRSAVKNDSGAAIKPKSYPARVHDKTSSCLFRVKMLNVKRH